MRAGETRNSLNACYYSHRDCGKTATYCYTVPPIWHNFVLFVIIITISSVYVYVYRCKLEIQIHFTSLHFTSDCNQMDRIADSR